MPGWGTHTRAYTHTRACTHVHTHRHTLAHGCSGWVLTASPTQDTVSATKGLAGHLKGYHLIPVHSTHPFPKGNWAPKSLWKSQSEAPADLSPHTSAASIRDGSGSLPRGRSIYKCSARQLRLGQKVKGKLRPALAPTGPFWPCTLALRAVPQ